MCAAMKNDLSEQNVCTSRDRLGGAGGGRKETKDEGRFVQENSFLIGMRYEESSLSSFFNWFMLCCGR